MAFFCHGLPHSIQLGFDLQTVHHLARAIAQSSRSEVVVIHYCCSTASTIARLRGQSVGGDGGFADELRDALCRAGVSFCRVVEFPHLSIAQIHESLIRGPASSPLVA